MLGGAKSSAKRPWATLGLVLGALAYICGTCYLLYYPAQSDVGGIYLGYGLAFLGYVIWWQRWLSHHAKFALAVGVGLGVLVRVLALFAQPNLSDDVYRFVWDGQCMHTGISPYAELPRELMRKGMGDPELFSKLNSPDYYSVYPPLAQGIYYLAAWPGTPWVGSVLTIKVMLLFGDLIALFFLLRLIRQFRGRSAVGWALLYFCHPLLVVEGVGNLHFEGLMVAAMLASVYYVLVKRVAVGGLLVGIAAAIKLPVLILTPYVFFKLNGRQRWQYFGAAVAFTALAYAPFWSQFDAVHFMQSLDLYFRRFEFNASVYYVLRAVGYALSGYNLIQILGPLLALVVLGLAARRIWADKRSGLQWTGLMDYGIAIWTIYLLLSTTVHPWYVIGLMALGVLRGRIYALIWGMAVVLTYINYSYEPYWENGWVVALEYSILMLAIWLEWKKPRLAV